MEHVTHDQHDHQHGAGCGHTGLQHGNHTDYLHDGHLHSMHGDHIDEHQLSVSAEQPDACDSGHACADHPANHVHGAQCGHEAVPHGNHEDYLVSSHLHHAHAGHCDDHGAVTVAAR